MSPVIWIKYTLCPIVFFISQYDITWPKHLLKFCECKFCPVFFFFFLGGGGGGGGGGVEDRSRIQTC